VSAAWRWDRDGVEREWVADVFHGNKSYDNAYVHICQCGCQYLVGKPYRIERDADLHDIACAGRAAYGGRA